MYPSAMLISTPPLEIFEAQIHSDRGQAVGGSTFLPASRTNQTWVASASTSVFRLPMGGPVQDVLPERPAAAGDVGDVQDV